MLHNLHTRRKGIFNAALFPSGQVPARVPRAAGPSCIAATWYLLCGEMIRPHTAHNAVSARIRSNVQRSTRAYPFGSAASAGSRRGGPGFASGRSRRSAHASVRRNAKAIRVQHTLGGRRVSARGVGRVVGADCSAPRPAAIRWAAPDPMEATNFEAAGQDDVVVEARRRLVVGVVVVPKADVERHGREYSARQTAPLSSPKPKSPKRPAG